MINQPRFKPIAIRNDKAFMSAFLDYPEHFRIEAVIHDGQWYTVDKLVSISKASKEVVERFVECTPYLIREKDSFRVSGEEVLRWYKEKRLSISDPLIPNNFTPKICEKKTELEHFLDNPKRLYNILYIYVSDVTLAERIERLIHSKGIGFVQNECINLKKLKCHTLSPAYVSEVVLSSLSSSERQSVNFFSRFAVRIRDVRNFPNAFIEKTIIFYEDFAKKALKTNYRTMDIFLPNKEDKIAQIHDWIFQAMRSFEPNGGVPFSAYLLNVLGKWVFDLANNEVGQKLAKFQRERQKVIGRYQEKNLSYTEEMIKNDLSDQYSSEDYDKLLEEHRLWYNSKQCISLQDDTKGIGVSLRQRKQTAMRTSDVDSLSALSIALLRAFETTDDLESFERIIEVFSSKEIANVQASPVFKETLYNEYIKTIKWFKGEGKNEKI